MAHSNIDETEVEQPTPAGVPEGTVLDVVGDDGVVTHQEKVVHEYDEDGKPVAFHKEVENG